jgi:hypothetical protein
MALMMAEGENHNLSYVRYYILRPFPLDPTKEGG